ncbi:ABC transporter permease [Rathayibacter soli]|uniref:ABC transporter permease n=1 Tax=Rathayibacter soli TaxID=3144168 RepID=UPI0027E4A7F1|nr:ABC transporter permease [Glaciibacter superstes]
MRRREASGPRLQLKQAAAFRGGLIALGVVVLVATVAVTAWPRAVATLLTSDLQHRVSVTSPVSRDVETTVTTYPYRGQVTGDLLRQPTVTQIVTQQLAAQRASMPVPLKNVLIAGDAATRSTPLSTSGPRFNYAYNVQLEGYAGLEQASTLSSGRWPRATTAGQDDTAVEFVMTGGTATAMGWKLGETRRIRLGGLQPVGTVTLVGTITPHLAADFWQREPLRASAALENLGDRGFKLTAIGWVAPAQWHQLVYQVGANTYGWYGVNSSAFTASTVGQVQGQLARFVAAPPPPGAAVPLRFDTRLDATLSDYVASAGPAQTLLFLLATGPLGVALAVLFLGIELLVERRRSALALLSARGASALRIRGSLGLEALVVSLPAAVLGAAVTVLLLPGPVDALTLLLAACCAIVPALAMAVLGGPQSRAERRFARGQSDERARSFAGGHGFAGGGRFARWRWIIELALVAIAVVAALTLFQRGLTPTVGSIAADPLVVATPLLICIAVAILIIRVLPALLAAVAAVLRRRRGAVGFVGAIRGERTSAAVLVPVLAVLVGVAVSVFSSAIFTTETTGVEQSARGQVGADLSVSAPQLTAAQLERMHSIPGVAALVTVAQAGYATLNLDGSSQAVFLLIADTAALARLQSDLPGSARTPEGMGRAIDARAPMLLGGWDTNLQSRDGTLTGDGTPLSVRVALPTAVPGDFITTTPWVLLDPHAVPKQFELPSPTVTTALITVKPGTDQAQLAQRLQAIGGANTSVETAAARVGVARSAPIVGGLQGMLMVGLALSVLLCLLALSLTLLVNAANRRRFTGMLRTLGFTARQSAALVMWEIAPIVTAGLIGGIVAGLVLPMVILAPLNLAAFTGGLAHPTVVIDAALVAIAVGGFIVLCAAVAVFASFNARRSNVATILRTGEDE